MTLQELVVKITGDTSGLEKSASKASSIAGSIGKTVGKGLAVAGAAAATATVALVKGAVESYASYEQLIGGVETLFKDSAGVVEQYANNAYKTAGMSANQYMETVTSFSASLLQSLGGDTEAAAKKADLAITDMADNANKMGSSMESVENAYKGFAKQNYTMLDNLKLGYGGTKAEMERLLADAEKLSGVKYDISSYSDIIDAIHVVQTEMGITGTTAKEASSTIEGSLNSMKAAWANVVTGIADENADFDTLISNLVDSVGTFADNIIPRITQALKGVGTLIEKLAPVIAEQLPGLIEAILPPLLDAVAGLVTSLIQALPDLISTIITAISDFINSDSLPTLIQALIDGILGLVDAIVENLPLLIDAGIQLIVALGEGLIEALPQIIEKLPEIIDGIINGLLDNIDAIIEAGVQLLVSIVSNLPAIIAGIVKAIPAIIKAIFKAIVKGAKEMLKAGKELVKGLWQGLKDSIGWIKDKITGWVGNVLSFIKGLFGIHSPSRKMAEDGKYLVMGLGKGITDSTRYATDALKDTAKQMEKAFKPQLEVPEIDNIDVKGIIKYGIQKQDLTRTPKKEEIVEEVFDRISSSFGTTPVILQVDGKTFAETSIKTINTLTRQTGKLSLNLV